MKILLTMMETARRRKLEVVKTTATTSNSLGLETYENRGLTYLARGGQS